MKGLEICEKFYLEHGLPMLEHDFAHIMDKICVGLVGSGSECLGYDDDISHDHDFECGFCIFIPDESVLDRRSAFLLERAYSKLPREFMGIKRSSISPVGGSRHGVIRIDEFLRAKTGTPDGALGLGDWLSIPEQSLLELTNGKIFLDGTKEMTKIRHALAYFPEDVRLKKLAGQLLLMGQAGQYNYGRCVSRSDFAGAQMCVIEFVKSAISVIFLLNRRYVPYYKWTFRALCELDVLSHLAQMLEYLISSPAGAPDKQSKIDEICAQIIGELQTQGLTKYKKTEMEGHAYSVNDLIENHEIRNLHILSAV